MAERGRFITLEGGEGAGKSTLARTLCGLLQALGLNVDVTREPGGTQNAEAIRELLVSGDAARWSPMAETLLLYAARVDHIEGRIEPALVNGDWVICDRFSDSTRAYQGAAGALDEARIAAIDMASLNAFKPDLTLILDLDPAVGLERTRSRGEAVTRFERHDLSFHTALREGFLRIAEKEAERCVVLDASQTPAQLADQAFTVIAKHFSLTP
ncbi:MAG: dTMP kinase [Pseudomonadota bacterium]